jgi:hypothetical protein
LTTSTSAISYRSKFIAVWLGHNTLCLNKWINLTERLCYTGFLCSYCSEEFNGVTQVLIIWWWWY